MNEGTSLQPTDSELVVQCLDGEPEAWETLIMRYRRLIYSIPNRFRFPPSDCDDVFQAVVVKLLEHLADLKDESKVGSWLITTTTRHCIQVRALKLKDVPDDAALEESPDLSETTEQIHIQADREEKIRGAIQNLPDRCRRLLELLFQDPSHPTYEEISHRLEMPVPSIGPTRARCIEKLQQFLRQRGIT